MQETEKHNGTDWSDFLSTSVLALSVGDETPNNNTIDITWGSGYNRISSVSSPENSSLEKWVTNEDNNEKDEVESENSNSISSQDPLKSIDNSSLSTWIWDETLKKDEDNRRDQDNNEVTYSDNESEKSKITLSPEEVVNTEKCSSLSSIPRSPYFDPLISRSRRHSADVMNQRYCPPDTSSNLSQTLGHRSYSFDAQHAWKSPELSFSDPHLSGNRPMYSPTYDMKAVGMSSPPLPPPESHQSVPFTVTRRSMSPVQGGRPPISHLGDIASSNPHVYMQSQNIHYHGDTGVYGMDYHTPENRARGRTMSALDGYSLPLDSVPVTESYSCGYHRVRAQSDNLSSSMGTSTDQMISPAMRSTLLLASRMDTPEVPPYPVSQLDMRIPVDSTRRYYEPINPMNIDYYLPPGEECYYEVEFKRYRRDIFVGTSKFSVGDYVKVEADRGQDLGHIVRKSREISTLKKPKSSTDGNLDKRITLPMKKVFRLATESELRHLARKFEEEQEVLRVCREKVRQRFLPMKVIDAEFQFDRHKLTFFFEADRRIDFRELVRDLFAVYKTRIWLQQISTANSSSLTLPTYVPSSE